MKTISGNKLFEKLNISVKNNLPLIILDSPKTPENIGSIMRLAGNMGISEIYILANDSNFRLSKIKKAASTASDYVKLKFISLELLNTLKEDEYEFIAIETCDTATNIYQFAFSKKLAFIFGNESNGISEEVLSLCDNALYIPLAGSVKSMNISHAVAVTLFEWYRKRMADSG